MTYRRAGRADAAGPHRAGRNLRTRNRSACQEDRTMRRALLGGLGIALGVLGRPAAAQEFPGRPAASHDSPTRSTPATRAARLGVPVAVPDPAAPPSDVTPAGVIFRGQSASPVQSFPTTAPVFIGTPQVAPGGASPLPAPRPVQNPPSLTEIRGPVTGGVPAGSGISAALPRTVPSLSAVEVPSVGPVDCGPGLPCPQPALDPPLVGGAPRFPAVGRLVGLGAPSGRAWLSAEYLMWWTRSTQLPVLATTSSPAFNGIVGSGDTQSVLGGSFGQTLHGGARFSGGWWFTDDQRRGVDARFMFLFHNGNEIGATTAAYPLLARPFFNANTPVGPFSEVVGAPGLAAGGIAAVLENSLWGADVNYRRFLAGSPCYRLDGLIGFRYLNFKETLSITEAFNRTPGSPMTVGAPALGGVINDRFRAENDFYGGQIGFTTETRRGRWFFNTRATIAFGTVHQTAEIAGGQALAFGPGLTAQYPGGLLALPGANAGVFSQNKFAVLPEVGFNIGYHITPHLRAFVGYNFLYLSSVLRASGTIDPVVDAARIPNFPLPGNPAILPGTPHPAPQFRTTDFWAQGINFGLQWTW